MLWVDELQDVYLTKLTDSSTSKIESLHINLTMKEEAQKGKTYQSWPIINVGFSALEILFNLTIFAVVIYGIPIQPVLWKKFI